MELVAVRIVFVRQKSVPIKNSFSLTLLIFLVSTDHRFASATKISSSIEKINTKQKFCNFLSISHFEFVYSGIGAGAVGRVAYV